MPIDPYLVMVDELEEAYVNGHNAFNRTHEKPKKKGLVSRFFSYVGENSFEQTPEDIQRKNQKKRQIAEANKAESDVEFYGGKIYGLQKRISSELRRRGDNVDELKRESDKMLRDLPGEVHENVFCPLYYQFIVTEFRNHLRLNPPRGETGINPYLKPGDEDRY